jgi:hypothetical protein
MTSEFLRFDQRDEQVDEEHQGQHTSDDVGHIRSPTHNRSNPRNVNARIAKIAISSTA